MITKAIRKAKEDASTYEKLKNKEITQRQASNILKLSIRQIKRNLKKYRQLGLDGLIHKNIGKKSNRKLNKTIEEEVLRYLNELKKKIGAYGPTYANKKLLEKKQISINCETTRKIMINNGFWKGRIRKIKRHYWRDRKLCIGQMVQVDGSKHKWFNDEYYTLLAFVDDATSKIMYAKFVKEETTESLSMATKEYVKRYGRPISLYVDRGKVFKVNMGKTRGITEYHRMLKELDIELKFAYSPQAKGRVERAFQTLQNNLVKDLKLEDINSVEQANIFIVEYITKYNNEFSTKPSDSTDVHKSIEGFSLNTIFCIKKYRILKHDNTIEYNNRCFLILQEQSIKIKSNDRIGVYISFDGSINLYKGNTRLNCREIAKPEKKIKKIKERIVRESYYRPPLSHPFRNPGTRDENGKYLR